MISLPGPKDVWRVGCFDPLVSDVFAVAQLPRDCLLIGLRKDRVFLGWFAGIEARPRRVVFLTRDAADRYLLFLEQGL